MESFLRQTLRGLCEKSGWNYAVFWRLKHRSRMMLTWEDGYCDYEKHPSVANSSPYMVSGMPHNGMDIESGACNQESYSLGDQLSLAVAKMSYQVFSLGEGIIGRVASTGKHQWIFGGRAEYVNPECPISWHNQFAAGVRTIAVIAVMPHGVVQLGSTGVILEDLGIVQNVKSHFVTFPQFVTENARDAVADNLQGNSSSFVLKSLNQFTDSAAADATSSSSPKNQMRPSVSKYAHLDIIDQFAHPFDPASVQNLSVHNFSFSSPRSVNRISEASNSSSTSDNNVHRNSHSANITNLEMLSAGDKKQLSASSTQICPLSDTIPGNRVSDNNETRLNAKSDVTLAGQFQPHDKAQADGKEKMIFSPRQEGDQTSTMARPWQNNFRTSSANDSLLETLILNQERLKLTGLQKPNEFPRDSLLQNKLNPPSRFSSSALQFGNTKVKLENPLHTAFNRSFSVPGAESYATHLRSPMSCTDISSHSKLRVNKDAIDSSTSLPGNSGLSIAEPVLTYQQSWLKGLSVKDLHEPRQHDYIIRSNVDSKGLKSSQFGTSKNNYIPSNHESFEGTIYPRNQSDAFSIGSIDQLSLFSEDPSGSELLEALRPVLQNGLETNKLDENPLNRDVDSPKSEAKMASISQISDHQSEAVVTQCSEMSLKPSDEWFSSENSCADLLDAIVANVCAPVNPDIVDNSSQSARSNTSYCSLSKADSYSAGQFSSFGQQDSRILDFGPSRYNVDARKFQNITAFADVQDVSVVNNSSSVSSASAQMRSLDVHSESLGSQQAKSMEEPAKTNRKRARPGESTRPRPKDRQQIQDRVKELRELIPNGAKCSIDALLERTIKHMVFLQAVTKYADKLKQSNESKVLEKSAALHGLGGAEGGASWAFEVEGQTVQCPIIVENLNQPRQMLVEMLCEERGLFLEIADIIRRLGLTILKGVMELRSDKVWARFIVEANRDVHRVEILWSLMQLLQPSRHEL